MPHSRLKFRHAWRPYQQRVLAVLDQHLHDRKLHIVAAPGAGKTTLGLEIFRRLQKRALVLSPTRIIRDQWLQRLDDFCDCADVHALDWVSSDLRAPAILTSVTYQALHAQFAGDLKDAAVEQEEPAADSDTAKVAPLAEGEVQEIIRILQKHAIEVLILDEAHHLRAEWWRALDKVCTALPGMVVVSLTATPPYDALEHEWLRYEQLCGPIDEEISVPELVKAGTLCPHQDYVWAVEASPTEKQRIQEHDARVTSTCEALFGQAAFNALVLRHPWLGDAVAEQDVSRMPNIALAILVFLKARQHPLPERLCAILDLGAEDIPALGRRWWQVLLEAVMFDDSFLHDEADRLYVEQLKKTLRAAELLRNRELSLERSRRLERSLSLSSAKIAACVNIHKLEYKHQGEALRQVVLTDFIRDEQRQASLDIGDANLGAWPVFSALVTASSIPQQLALLSGRISVVHASLLERLLQNLDRNRITWKSLDVFPAYVQISGPLNQLTKAFTALLLQGGIKTLVGTRALLGEGWDAPAVNSLVLASAVGSFMLTNQMRGRAIRIDRQAPGKVSSVWHLVACDTRSYDGLSDYADLRRRFDTFVGLSERSAIIENGFERMNAKSLEMLRNRMLYTDGVGSGSILFGERDLIIAANNWQMMRRYRKRATLPGKWQAALALNPEARVWPCVNTAALPELRSFHIKNTLRYLVYPLATALVGMAGFAGIASIDSSASLKWLLPLGAAAVLMFQLPKTIAIIRTLVMHLPVDGSLKQIGHALKVALCQTGDLESPTDRLKILTTKNMDGSIHVTLTGGRFHESSLFADCFAEILAPIDNPRYLVTRKGARSNRDRQDYHAVPLVLATRKESAETFAQAWRKYVSPTRLIYTRSEEGRQLLLKARAHAFSAVFQRMVRRQDRWQ